jgi:hypothetical protein
VAQQEEKRILDFLVELAQNPPPLTTDEEFEAVLIESGLSNLQKNVLRSANFTRIYQAIEAEGGVDQRAFLIAIIVC